MEISRAGSVSLSSLFPINRQLDPADFPDDPAPMLGSPEQALNPARGDAFLPPSVAGYDMAKAPMPEARNVIVLAKDGEAVGVLEGEAFPIARDIAKTIAECLLHAYVLHLQQRMFGLASAFGLSQATQQGETVPEASGDTGLLSPVSGESLPDNSATEGTPLVITTMQPMPERNARRANRLRKVQGHAT